MNDNNRDNLLHCITTTSFVMDDLRLFLDTHPTDQEALAHWNRTERVRSEAIEEYGKLFGPITMYQANEQCEWAWVNEPWPWEGRC